MTVPPSFRNAGLSVPILSSGALNGSSSSMTLDVPFFPWISTTAISFLNLPVRVASCARRYDSREKSSCCSRVKLNFVTHNSAQLPMCLSPYGSQRPSWIMRSSILPLPMR